MKYWKIFLPLLILSLHHLSAHSLSGSSGFGAGLEHPVLGLDHFLAMVSVGLVSTQVGKNGIWTIPATFVFSMIPGGLLGMTGFSIPGFEIGISLSVVFLGASLFIADRIPLYFVFLIVSFFALFHGYAHGVEMPALSHPMAYFSGFVMGTTGIHLIGVLAGTILLHIPTGKVALRFTGGCIATMGIYLIFTA